MTTALDRYRQSSNRRRQRAERANYRLDIQGLRAVAVIAVIACHLCGWPRGGFVGVDVFFVIAGFFITEVLLRKFDEPGTVSFRTYYWERLRRIVPTATIVLILTFAASALVLPALQAHTVGIDALFAFVFLSNWRFAADGAHFSAATDSVSPLLHYWPLSIEEQFYLVWPALILAISLVAIRKAWSRARWMLLTGGAAGIIVAASLSWSLYETATSPAWAFLNTFSRVWELAVGALLATAVSTFARLPDWARPLVSWAGLGLVAASMFLITDNLAGFPAPWALMPVAGAALVIAAGVGTEPSFQGLLRNRVSTYLGDISYSLYLVHWPVIVLLGTMMATTRDFYLAALAGTFGLAMALHHLVENPLRYASRERIRDLRYAMKHGLFETDRSTKAALVGSLILLTVAVIAYAMRPDAF